MNGESGERAQPQRPTTAQDLVELRRFFREARIPDLGKRELNAFPRLLSYYLDLEDQLRKRPARTANRMAVYGLLLAVLQLVVIVAGIVIGNHLAGGPTH